MPRLFVSLPEKKPPFIGVVFPDFDSNIAERLNENIVNQFEETILYVNLYERKAEIILIGKNTGRLTLYRDLDYDLEAFKRWLSIAEAKTNINFGHVVHYFGTKERVPKTFTGKQPFFIPLNRVFVFNERHFKYVKVERF